MIMFGLSWNFDKSYYSPSDHAIISLWAVNYDNKNMYVTDIAVESDFGTYSLPQTVCGIISPQNVTSPNPAFLGCIDMKIPTAIIGTRKFNLRYRNHHFEKGQWIAHPVRLSKQFTINIFKMPIYRVFLSRGTRFEDRIVGDYIAQMVREWKLLPVTVGIEIPVPDRVTKEINDSEIQNSAGLIVIITPRILDHSIQAYETIKWLHNERGMSYAKRKPVMILKDRDVILDGLTSHLNSDTQLEFDPANLYELKTRLSLAISWFRESIEGKNMGEFYKNLKDLALDGLKPFDDVVLLSGIIGSHFEK